MSDAPTTEPKAVLIRFPIGKRGSETTEGERIVPGWIVPGTDDLFGVDMRYEGSLKCMQENVWRITHLPSGFAVTREPYTDAFDREKAFAVAQRAYAELKRAGCDFSSDDPKTVTAAYKALPAETKRQLWERIAGKDVTHD